MTADEERQALEDLLKSPGWRLYAEQMAKAWGAEAFEQSLDRELVNAAEEHRLATPPAVMLNTFRGVRASFTWPATRLRHLTGAASAKTEDAVARQVTSSRLHRAYRDGVRRTRGGSRAATE